MGTTVYTYNTAVFTDLPAPTMAPTLLGDSLKNVLILKLSFIPVWRCGRQPAALDF